MEEKIYTFERATGPDKIEKIIKTEDELTDQDRNLLYATLVHNFNKLPEDLQYRFLREITGTAIHTMTQKRMEKYEIVPMSISELEEFHHSGASPAYKNKE